MFPNIQDPFRGSRTTLHLKETTMQFRKRIAPEVVGRHDHKANVLKLIEIIEVIPAKQFNMRLYSGSQRQCGTIGCALGWAAMSGEIPGLGWSSLTGDADHSVFPVVNRERSSWSNAGEEVFGWRADNVFQMCDRVIYSQSSKGQVISRLQEIADGL